MEGVMQTLLRSLGTGEITKEMFEIHAAVHTVQTLSEYEPIPYREIPREVRDYVTGRLLRRREYDKDLAKLNNDFCLSTRWAKSENEKSLTIIQDDYRILKRGGRDAEALLLAECIYRHRLNVWPKQQVVDQVQVMSYDVRDRPEKKKDF